MKMDGIAKYFKTVNGEILDFKQVNTFNQTPLMYVFYYNKSNNLNLSEDQLDYLIKNSDLKKVDNDGWSILKFALIYDKDQNLNLTKNIWKYLIENSDLSLINDKDQLISLKKIQSELLNDEIMSKIEITEDINKKIKI